MAVAIAGLGGYLIYNKVTAAINSNTPVAVKNVVGIYYKGAEQNLQEEGFQTQTVQASSATVPETLVISQNPAPGTRVAKQSVVTLTVSTGKPKTTVPTLVNLPLGQAQTDLANANLKVTTKSVNSTRVPAGSVTSSSPAAGTPVLVGSLVTLYVSQGPRQIGVPSVVGEPYANAAGALQGANFKVTRTDVPNAAPIGQVVSQTPAGGTSAAVNSTVTLTVSKGPQLVGVPNVTQDDRGTATQLLQQAGFTVSVTPQDVTDPTQNGLVLAQDPTTGNLPQGATVTITVGHLVTAPPATTATTTPTTPAVPTTTTTTTTTPPAGSASHLDHDRRNDPGRHAHGRNDDGRHDHGGNDHGRHDHDGHDGQLDHPPRRRHAGRLRHPLRAAGSPCSRAAVRASTRSRSPRPGASPRPSRPRAPRSSPSSSVATAAGHSAATSSRRARPSSQ